MSTLEIIIAVLVVLIVLLFIGGLIAVNRHAKALDDELTRRIEAANEALADAHAQDKGWKRESLEKAARSAFEAEHPDVVIDSLHLVQVVDRPGTEADQAVFHVLSGGTTLTVTLGRNDSKWTAV